MTPEESAKQMAREYYERRGRWPGEVMFYNVHGRWPEPGESVTVPIVAVDWNGATTAESEATYIHDPDSDLNRWEEEFDDEEDDDA